MSKHSAAPVRRPLRLAALGAGVLSVAILGCLALSAPANAAGTTSTATFNSTTAPNWAADGAADGGLVLTTTNGAAFVGAGVDEADFSTPVPLSELIGSLVSFTPDSKAIQTGGPALKLAVELGGTSNYTTLNFEPYTAPGWAAGQNTVDRTWWSSHAETVGGASIPAQDTNGGPTLAAWEAAFPNAEVLAVGVGEGTANKGSSTYFGTVKDVTFSGQSVSLGTSGGTASISVTENADQAAIDAAVKSATDPLNAQIKQLQSQLASANPQVASLNAQIAALEKEVYSLEHPPTPAANLVVDGIEGYNTIGALQLSLGVPETHYLDSTTVKAEQRHVGDPHVDGIQGPETWRYISKHDAAAGFGNSNRVKGLQQALNAGKF